MFIPERHLSVPCIVTWIAGLGAQGKLNSSLGFVHPGDAADALDLPAEVTARLVLGEKLAGGVLTAQMILDPSGVRLPVPAFYWSGSGAAETMKTGWLDFSALGFSNDLHMAIVILSIDEVAAALGFRLAPPAEVDPNSGTREAAEVTRTGTAGRPTSIHLIRLEHARRFAAGEAHKSISAEAADLAAWIAAAHPTAPQPKAKAIENAIRDDHRRHLAKPPK